MPQWWPFLAWTLVVVVAVLVLAHKSQQLIEQVDDRPDDGATETSAISATETADQSEQLTEPWYPEDGDPGDTSSTVSDETEKPTPSSCEQPIELTARLLLANVAFTQALVATTIVGLAWYFAIPVDAFGVTTDSLSTDVPAIVGGVVFGLALWIFNETAATIADVVGAAYDERVRELLAPESTGGWLALFGVVLPLIAFTEELLFRAALIGVPEAGLGFSPWLLAVGSSLAFALGHGAQGRVGIVVTGVLGFALAVGYILSGSLLLVVVAHYVVNALEFFVHEYLGIESVFGDRLPNRSAF